MDFSTFPKFRSDLFESLDDVLSNDIPEIMAMLPKPSESDEEEKEADNPFAEVELNKGVATWRVTQAHKSQCDTIFSTLKQINGKVGKRV